MKQTIFSSLLFFVYSFASSQSVGIGTGSPNASSLLELQSNSKGLLLPRMTMAERNAIADPSNGLMIYQTDSTTGFYYNAGTPSVPAWKMIGRSKDTIAISKYDFRPRGGSFNYEINAQQGAFIQYSSTGNELFAPVHLPPGGTVIQMIIRYSDFSTGENLRFALLKDNLITNFENGTPFSFISSGAIAGLRTAVINGTLTIDANPYHISVTGDNNSWGTYGAQLTVRGIQLIYVHQLDRIPPAKTNNSSLRYTTYPFPPACGVPA